MTLGLTEAQFWDYTPHHVLMLWKFHLAAEQRMDRRFGLIACLYSNSHRDRQLHPVPFEIDDFVPGNAATATPEQTAKNNVVQMVAQAKALTLAAKAKREKLTPYQVVMAARDMATA